MTETIKHAIIVCHPLEKSFTMALAQKYAVLKAKEREGKPAPDVEREWIALGKPDVYVLVYPIWFGTPPAMLANPPLPLLTCH